MSSKVICCAPDCQTSVFGSDDHCKFHAKKFLPLYNKYKKLQRSIDRYVDNPSLITKELTTNELMRLVGTSNRVAEARDIYRKTAYRPEYHDKGHETMIQKLLGMYAVIDELLRQRFITLPELIPELVVKELGKDLPSDIREKVSSTSIAKELQQFKDSQQALEMEFATSMQHKQSYINIIRCISESFVMQLNLSLINECGVEPDLPISLPDLPLLPAEATLLPTLGIASITDVSVLSLPALSVMCVGTAVLSPEWVTTNDREVRLLCCNPKFLRNILLQCMGISSTLTILTCARPVNVSIIIDWSRIPSLKDGIELLYQQLTRLDFDVYDGEWFTIRNIIMAVRKQPSDCVLTISYNQSTDDINVVTVPYNKVTHRKLRHWGV